MQLCGHTKQCKQLFGYLYKHIADPRLREMIFLQAQSDGRAAYVILSQHYHREITDLEITQLNQEFDTACFEALTRVSHMRLHHPLRAPPQCGLNALVPLTTCTSRTASSPSSS